MWILTKMLSGYCQLNKIKRLHSLSNHSRESADVQNFLAWAKKDIRFPISLCLYAKVFL